MTDRIVPSQQATSPREQLMTFYGRIAQAWFRTETDISNLLPKPLRVADSHRAFIKVYQLKMRVGGVSRPPVYQYRQVCVTVLAAPPGHEERHYNLAMWDDRYWSAASGGVPPWNKRQADIEMTWFFPVEDRFLGPGQQRTFVCDVSTYAHPLLHFSALLDGVKRIDPPPLLPSGFYCGGGVGNLYAVPLRETYLGEPMNGTAELTFGKPPPNEVGRPVTRWGADVLGEVEVEGAVVQDVFFSRAFSDLTLVASPPFD